MLQHELLNDHAARMRCELNSADQGLLTQFAPEDYIARLEALPRVANLNDFGNKIPRICSAIQQRVGERGLECYHQLVMLMLLAGSNQALSRVELPSSIRSLYQENLERIGHMIVSGTAFPGFYLYPTFAKELAICALRLIPCGVLKVHLHDLPRRSLLATPTRILSALRLRSRLGWFKPLFEAHLDSHDFAAMSDFHAEGFRDACRTIASLLQCRPDVAGFFGVSWLHDPELARVSPKLAFVREVLLETGGVVLDGRPCTPSGIIDATCKSPKRKKLYDEGKYLPRSYLIVVPRAPLIAWATRG
jgi:hypothetical protein